MNLNEFAPFPLIDGHIHYPHPSQLSRLLDICDRLQINRFNVVCTPDRSRLSLIPDALHLKAQRPQQIYVFGGLDISAYFRAPAEVGQVFAAQIDQLLATGCDGVKMIEGKPDMRRMLPVPPFDSPAFAPYWEKMSASQVPIVFHVNDPEEFWDPKRIPGWAVERGWFYGDGSYINNEKQYTEIFNVLQHNPALKVIFAHFFFLSAQLSRLADLLDQYPGVHIDLTPGIEMYTNFSASIDQTRDFFIKYQDRILFGTDIGARALLSVPQTDIQFSESQGRVLLVRNFLENPASFQLQPDGGFLFGDQPLTLHGLGLPPEVLHKIYHANFERVVSPQPRPLQPAAIIDLCHQLEKMIQIQGSAQPGQPADTSVVRQVRAFFESVV